MGRGDGASRVPFEGDILTSVDGRGVVGEDVEITGKEVAIWSSQNQGVCLYKIRTTSWRQVVPFRSMMMGSSTRKAYTANDIGRHAVVQRSLIVL